MRRVVKDLKPIYVYQAIDGKVFADRASCIEYEKEWTIKEEEIKKEIHLWEIDKTPIDKIEDDSYADAFYIKVDTERACKYLRVKESSIEVHGESTFYKVIKEPGLYAYDGLYWNNMHEQVERCERELNRLKCNIALFERSAGIHENN